LLVFVTLYHTKVESKITRHDLPFIHYIARSDIERKSPRAMFLFLNERCGRGLTHHRTLTVAKMGRI